MNTFVFRPNLIYLVSQLCIGFDADAAGIGFDADAAGIGILASELSVRYRTGSPYSGNGQISEVDLPRMAKSQKISYRERPNPGLR